MFNTFKILGKKRSVIDHDAFRFYLGKSTVRNKKRIKEERHYAKMISSIYKKISESVIENEGGVFVNNMFYIIPQPYPEKTFVKITDGKKLKGTMNLHTGGKIYSLIFVNLFSRKEHRVWDMSSGFYNKLKKDFSDFLKKFSPTYIFSLDSISKIINNPNHD